MRNIGFIGFGNMAGAMAEGFIKSGGAEAAGIYAYAPHTDKLKKNCERLGINPVPSLKELVLACDVIFMACKPYQIGGVVEELGDLLCGKSVVSVAAGWDFGKYRAVLPDSAAVQCIMPNTPVAVSEGVFLIEESNDWDPDLRKELFDLLSGVGRVIELPDRLMNAGMAISGCGPAFMDMIIEALADAAVKNGIGRTQAYELVCRTMIGSAALQLATGAHPGQLKDNVCSPGGTTIKGVASLEESGIRSALIKAVDAVLV